VKGKVNAVTLDSCEKSGVVFDTSVASLEVVNSKGVKAQVLQSVPSIQIDNSAGVTIFLSKESLATEVYTSKSTEVNLNVPKGDDDTHETPIPYQFISKYHNGKWHTHAVEHVGV